MLPCLGLVFTWPVLLNVYAQGRAEAATVTVRVTVECPGVTPRDSERLIAVPLELAFSGLPGMMEFGTICRNDVVAVDFTFVRNGDVLRTVRDRMDSIQDWPAEAGKLQLVILPKVDHMRFAKAAKEMEVLHSVVQIAADAPSLQRAGIAKAELWRQVVRMCDPRDAPEMRLQKLTELKIISNAGEHTLTSLAEVKLVTQPKAIVRRDGRRLRELK